MTMSFASAQHLAISRAAELGDPRRVLASRNPMPVSPRARPMFLPPGSAGSTQFLGNRRIAARCDRPDLLA